MNEDPKKWSPEQCIQLGELCRRTAALLDADEKLQMGHALARAAAQMDLTPSPHMEAAVLRTVARVVMGGGIEQVARRAGILPGQN